MAGLNNLSFTILSQAILEAFTARLAALSAFSTNASPAPVARGDKVKVLFVDAADAAANFAGSYTMQNSDADGLDVSIDKHKFVGWKIKDKDWWEKPQLELQRFGRQKGFALAKAVLQDIWSLVTAANYGAAAFTGAAAVFDADDVVDISDVCDQADWPDAGRSLILKTSYHAALRKDNVVQQANTFGSSEPMRRGVIPSLDEFDMLFKSNVIPANGENLVGMAVVPDAILVAIRYLQPLKPAEYITAQPISDPETGVTFGYREWYDRDSGELRAAIEANYGFLKGNGVALKRLVSA